MTKSVSRKWHQRRELYLIAGIAIGITLMALPALTHLALGPVSPFERTDTFSVPSGSGLESSPIDAVVELFWITLPAIFFILALYWFIGRRRRWAGHETAVKWSRR